MDRIAQIIASLSSVGKVYKVRSNRKVANHRGKVNRYVACIVLFARRSSTELVSHAAKCIGENMAIYRQIAQVSTRWSPRAFYEEDRTTQRMNNISTVCSSCTYA